MTTLNIQIPIAGQPNATEDPKIITTFTNLSTWAAGNIDQTNIAASAAFLRLANRVMASSATAANGDMVNLGAGQTCTLPPVTANAMVGVIVFGGSGTVAGTNIYGLGLNAATSFSVGSGGVILHCDGTNWRIVAGQQDTGWQTFAVSTYTAGSITPAYRVVGDRVYVRGDIVNSTGSTLGGTAVATLPTGARPATQTSIPVLTSAFNAGTSPTIGAAVMEMFIQSTGVLNVNGNVGNAITVHLSGTWSLS